MSEEEEEKEKKEHPTKWGEGEKKKVDSGGIRTHATEVTAALMQRLRPLGHAAIL